MVELFEFMIARCAAEDLANAYVKYADYEALEAKLARLVEAAEYSKAAIDNYIHKEWGIQELQVSYDKLKAAIAATQGRE